jgi:endogenous inhibitor of DNA gyrase (YacG/DUF329 family)
MAKEKEMDQLTKDSISAEKAGMSYGKYMAMKHIEVEAPKKKTEDDEVLKCAICGKVMLNVRKNRMYCSPDCYAIAMSARARDRYRKKVTQCG